MSLLLMIAAVALMVVSFDRSASYTWITPERARVRAVFYNDGRIGYFHDESDFVNPGPGHHFANKFLTHAYAAGWGHGVPMGGLAAAPKYEFMGIIWAGMTNIQQFAPPAPLTENHLMIVIVPLWIVAVLFGVLPAISLTKFLRARQKSQRVKHGCCTACGYDLAGNVSGVCPECGTAIQEKAANIA